MEKEIKCAICQKNFKSITNSHLKKHNIIAKEYKIKFPGYNLVSEETIKKHALDRLGKKLSNETKIKISIKHKGKKLSEEHKNKLSIANKGKKLSIEHKEKIKKYQELYGNPKKGKKLSEESKKRIGLSGIGRVPWNKGLHISDIAKNKIREKLKGRKLTLETKLKMGDSRKGRKMSKEAKKKMSLAKKGKKQSLKHREKIFMAMRKSPNKFETECLNLFNNNKIPLRFVGDFKDKELFIEGKVPDFVATNGKKVLIEVYHDFFKIRDYGSINNFKDKRKEIFSKYGWKTLFLSYDEIKSNPNKCLEYLKKELENESEV